MSYRIFENGKALKDLTVITASSSKIRPRIISRSTWRPLKSAEKAAAENKFFAEVWQSQKDFADTVVPFWVQTSNAGLGRAR